MPEPESTTPPAEPKKGGGLPPMVLAIIVMVVMLLAAFALAYFVLPSRIADALKKAQAPAAAPADGGDSAATEDAPKPEAKSEGKAEAKGGEGGEKKAAVDFVITDILVNVAGTHAGHFLKATAYFDAPATVVAELERKRAKITDIVSSTLSQKSLDELSDPGIRGKLRSELLATINPLLETKGEITNIYFPEFIIQ